MYSECIVLEHPKNYTLCIEIQTILITIMLLSIVCSQYRYLQKIKVYQCLNCGEGEPIFSFKKNVYVPFLIINTPFKIYSGTRAFFFFTFPSLFLFFANLSVALFQDWSHIFTDTHTSCDCYVKQSITYKRTTDRFAVGRSITARQQITTTVANIIREFLFSVKSALVARPSYSIIYILLPHRVRPNTLAKPDKCIYA